MAVIFLKSTHFEGYRVRRMANGETREKYFRARELRGDKFVRLTGKKLAELRDEAHQYDLVLEKWQKRAIKGREMRVVPGPRNNTGVNGINFGFRYERLVGDRLAKYPAFVVHCRDTNGKQIKKTFVVSAHGYEGAWLKAVQSLIEIKRFPPSSKAEIMKRMPPESRTRRRRPRK